MVFICSKELPGLDHPWTCHSEQRICSRCHLHWESHQQCLEQSITIN